VSQAVGDLAILVASLVATAGAVRAARRGDASSRGWALMACATGLWSAAQLLWTFYGLTRDQVYPFPSLADAGYIGYAIPAIAGLLLFPRTAERGVSRFRVVLDGLVIAASVLVISWVLVLQSVAHTGVTGLVAVVSFGYPIADVVVGSLVLALGMRVPAGARRPWLLLGAGLIALTTTDSIYVSRTAQGDTGLTGTALALGWVCAFILIAIASQLRAVPTAVGQRRHFSVVQELLPYVPFAAALVVTHDRQFGSGEPFLFGTGAALLALFAVQQALIAVEKVQLLNGLEETVSRRTAELVSADERFSSLVQYSEDAIITKTTTGLITSWNPGAERLFGYSADEMLGQPVTRFIPAHLHAQERATLGAIARGEPVPNYETERVCKDGRVVSTSLTASPVYSGGVVAGVSAISHDISARKLHDMELAAARNAALDASRAKSEFLATMSHEIRTPMNGVIGLTGLLLDTSLDDMQRRYATGVRGAGEALLSIIDDILDFSKLEAGKVELEEVDYDPRQLVEEVGVLLATSATAKELELTAYCDPDVPLALRGDAGRLRQVLINLTSNAVKFTERGEVGLRARLATMSGGRVDLEFVVTDTGLGIAPADQLRMFEPFAQADASTTRRFGGTGLGLAICHRLVDAMGGELTLDSTPGGGTTFRCTVPMAERPLLAPKSPPAPDLLDGLAVLVVDDNDTNRFILETQLTAWGMRPVLAADGATALRLLRDAAAAGSPYPITVLDWCMPDVDGLDVAAEMLADETLQGTRAMLLSSAGPVDPARAREVGIEVCISKPVRLSELHDSLVRLAAPTAAPVRRAEPRAPSAAAASSTARGRVLVVEDNHVNQMVAEGVLRNLGFAVEIAADGRAGLTAMEAGGFDAVLMDCHMPEMDGYEATREWRRREGAGARLPIIAMTAGVLAGDRERCIAAGMDDFVPKPIDVAALDRALEEWTTTARGVAVTSPSAGLVDIPAPSSALDDERLEVLRRLGPDDGWGLLPAVVDAYLDETPEQVDAILCGARDGDHAAVGAAAHKLRGAAGNIGAAGVARLCAAIESAARASSPWTDDEALAGLADEVALANTALTGALVGRP
jgi:PAS domain S-box-containing protein